VQWNLPTPQPKTFSAKNTSSWLCGKPSRFCFSSNCSLLMTASSSSSMSPIERSGQIFCMSISWSSSRSFVHHIFLSFVNVICNLQGHHFCYIDICTRLKTSRVSWHESCFICIVINIQRGYTSFDEGPRSQRGGIGLGSPSKISLTGPGWLRSLTNDSEQKVYTKSNSL